MGKGEHNRSSPPREAGGFGPRPRGTGPAAVAPPGAGADARRLELLNRIGARALGEAEFDAFLAGVAGDACRLLGLARCAILLEGEPGRWIRHAGEGFELPSPDADPLLRGSGRGDPLSVIRVPVEVEGVAAGTLAVDLGPGREPAEGDLAATAATARQIAIVVRNVRILRRQRDLAGRLMSLMNNVPGLVYRALSDGSVTFMGAGADRLTGHAAQEFLDGRVAWVDLIHPDDRQKAVDTMRRAAEAREDMVLIEYRLRARDGEVRWIGDRRQLAYGPDGRLRHIDGLALDITERRRTEERLRLTQFSVDRAGDAAYWMGADGRLLYVNDEACRALGYGREELLAMTIFDIDADLPRERWAARWEDLRRRKVVAAETRHRAADGRLIPVEVTANYIEFDGEEYNCASARDITGRRLAEEESRGLQGQLLLAEKIEAVAGLAGGIAHDFNNLLTAVLGHAGLLLRASEPGSEAWRAASAIQSAADRASQLTSQLLGFARKGKNLEVPVDLKRVVEGAVKALAPAAGSRITIVTDLHDGAATVLGDPHQIEGAVAQLVANAIDAMPTTGTATISTEEAALDDAFCRTHPGAAPGRCVVVKVADTGVGISRENLGRVFDPFFTTKGQGKGTGLGLSMVYGVVKSHGGYIDVESEPGRGTTFRIFLPLAAVEAHQLEIPFDAPPPAERERRRGLILLVDDQEAVRNVCAEMIRTLGYEVVTAVDGAEGLDRYRLSRDDIDLVILDMVMPRMDGRSCFRGMKAVNPRVRAILATGYSIEGSVQEILDEGVAGFIQKPFRLEQLSRAIDRALGRSS